MLLKLLFVFVLIISFFIFFIIQKGLFSYNKSTLTLSSKQELEEKPWEKIFSELTNERLGEINYSSLKEKPIISDSKEIRLWIIDGSPLRGIILEKNISNWKAIQIPPKNTRKYNINLPVELPDPKSGWDSLIEKLDSLNLEKLPDMSELDIGFHGYDATSVVIEIKNSDGYRNYMYRGLNFDRIAKMEYPKKVKDICLLLSEEFGIDMFYYNEQ